MVTQKQIIIAGPCAAESRKQVLACASTLKKQGIKVMRASLWKPRTKPGFEGVGLEGSSWFARVTNLGITIGTEILLPEQVTSLVSSLCNHNGDPTKILFWLGSRNQNHVIQREIVRRILEEAPNNVRLLIKNQPWSDEAHWLGIVDHIISVGIEPQRIILCHRGFSPNGQVNSNGFRNLPDFDMAMRVKEATKLPMLLDPSHIGGSVENVFKSVEIAADFDFDGLMVEVHPTPSKAQTDAKQQLTFQELDRLLALNKRDGHL
jgi:3-deoxy-D-arabino-heptulosonate 7-phosphate (DAHP) synthase